MAATCDFRSNFSCWRETVSAFNQKWADLMISVEVMMCFFMIVGVFGNILVLATYAYRRQKTTANIFIMFLACIDLFTCVVLHPYIIYKLFHNYDQTWKEICKLFEFLIHCSLTLSGLTLLLVAIDRYLAICRPVKFLLFDKHVVKATAAISVVSVIVSLPVLELYGATSTEVIEFQSNFTGFKCHFKDDYQNSPLLTAFGAFVLCGFLFEIVAMAILYKNVAVTAYKSRRRVAPLSNAHILAGIKPSVSNSEPKPISGATQSSSSNAQQHLFSSAGKMNDAGKVKVISDLSLKQEANATTHTEDILRAKVNVVGPLNSNKTAANRKYSTRLKAAKILFSVTMVFFLSWMPFFVMRICYSVNTGYWNDNSENRYILENLLNHVFYANNAANPIIYTIINKNFRLDCKYFFTKLFSCVRNT